LCECFRELIPTLKPEYAALIERLELAEGDPAEVAGELNISRNNLKVRRHRARQALRERLEQTCRLCAEHACLDCTCKRT
jgi:DNA-directed RNA polymerase specialized sigma24 family protein